MQDKIGIFGALAAVALLGGALAPAPAAAAGRMEFELPTLSGRDFIKLDDFAGRPILINVWGTECPPCIIETPLLTAQSQIYKNVQFLGIGTDERVASLLFVNRFHVQYPQLQAPQDPTGLLRRLGDPDGALPFTVVLDTKHRVCASRHGAVDAGWIATTVRKCAAD